MKAQQWRVISKCQLLVVNIQFGFVSPRIYHVIKTSLATDDCIKLFVYVMLYKTCCRGRGAQNENISSGPESNPRGRLVHLPGRTLQPLRRKFLLHFLSVLWP